METVDTQALPSKDPAADGLAGLLQGAFTKLMQNMDDMLPAVVTTYDREKNVATVRPVVQVVSTTGESMGRAAVAEVPVLALGGGGFFVGFPVKGGDLGWIKANDRDISHYMQGMREARPNTFRKHSFEDGLFIPDVLRKYTIDPEDLDSNMVIQHIDGKIRIALWDDRIKVTAKETHVVVKDDGTIEAVAPEKIVLDTPLVEITGGFISGTKSGKDTVNRVSGGIHTTGPVTSDVDVIAGGISGKNHIHPGTEKPV